MRGKKVKGGQGKWRGQVKESMRYIHSLGRMEVRCEGAESAFTERKERR